MITTCYCVDISAKILRVESMEYVDYKEELRKYNYKCLLDLQDHDLFTFKTIKEAENFIDKYLSIYNNLDNDILKSIKGCPKLLLKRKYIPTTLLKIKTYTTRNRKLKNCGPGDYFQLYDQTFFVTAKMKEIKKVKIENNVYFEHHYEIVQ